jgi:hypothetical protein
MSLNRQGSHLLLNCVDKVVRLADVRPSPEGTQPVSKEAAEDALRAAAVSTRSKQLHTFFLLLAWGATLVCRSA